MFMSSSRSTVKSFTVPLIGIVATLALMVVVIFSLETTYLLSQKNSLSSEKEMLPLPPHFSQQIGVVPSNGRPTSSAQSSGGSIRSNGGLDTDLEP
jgi:hypothetical protein